jgi:hypothetical protein
LGHLDFDIVSDFVLCPEQSRRIRISDLKLRDASYELRNTQYASEFILSEAEGLHETAARQLSRNLYKSPLFMQNKPNVKIGKMNISVARIRLYDNQQRTINNEWRSKQSQFKPNSKPNKPNLQKAQMNVSLFVTKHYENDRTCAVRQNKAKTKPKQTQFARGSN